jgi:hypothetical protein
MKCEREKKWMSKRQNLPDVRPTRLGGAPIPSELSITPTHYDAALGCLHVEFENIADPVETRNSILESLQAQAEQMGVPDPSEDDLPAELDLNSGWPTAIHTERSIILSNQSRVETTSITFVEPDEE